ncbi:MAG: N-acetylglucosamine kinase [Flavobacteriaceae bacterium]|nr:N-acetylglucosamine kinase [Flavobacteriaceae bacterium]|tara:strand:+ start:889 stop:1743 length:855 start_codon:yes stop_codon:yes gene_type:complete
MRLIVDSGSTKTDWICLNDEGKLVFETQTLGLNPQVLDEHIIEERIINNYDLYQNRKNISHLFFYGAGCGTEPPKKLIKKVFESIFVKASIDVKEDTLAAVYSAATRGEKSIVSIIGTGSNCTYFDGENIHQKITSLGYILMDDSSGNYFGRQLIRDYFFNKMPSDILKKFSDSFDLDPNLVKDKLYKKPNPNTYLATFAKFVVENKNNVYCSELIKKGFNLFITNQIEQFPDCKEIPLHFIGSISFYLKDELDECLKNRGMILGNVLKKPIEGLVNYHLKYSN